MIRILLTLILFFCGNILFAQDPTEPVKDNKSKELITQKEDKNDGKSTPSKEADFEMKKYWFVMLIKGKNRDQDSVAAAQIQKGHLDNINRLYDLGKILVAGPFGDKGDWRGIFIMDCKDQAEAEELLQTDPAIKAGRLAYEIHPWWTAKNSVFK